MIKHKELLRGDEEQLKRQAASEEKERMMVEQRAKESRSGTTSQVTTVGGIVDAHSKDLERGDDGIQVVPREEDIEMDKIGDD